ncbi:uncharacterized protein LOC102360600 [Latimeria chalumnae]|uniref:uncharacterized protein LOC102360600 n=1 Tax=Latimeria chalumnae TaxID=7897 RepID=UPI00313EFC07
MSEGWEECPLLGPGWKRREALRRSGASFGKSDTYYMSPSGERFRSKIELVRFVGSTIDLTNFNFKLGILEDPTDRKIRKRYRFSMDRSDLEPQPKRPKLSFSDSFDGVHLNGTVAEDTLTVCCSSCNKWVSGVNFGKHKLSKWNCANCRAERRAFTKEQNFYKRYGCGVCNACLITEDCGYCVICSTKEKSPSEANPNWKCVSRRCLRVVRKRVGCGFCKGCQTTEDCGLCRACLKQKAHPEEEHPGKCLKRVCIKKKQKRKGANPRGNGIKKKPRTKTRRRGKTASGGNRWEAKVKGPLIPPGYSTMTQQKVKIKEENDIAAIQPAVKNVHIHSTLPVLQSQTKRKYSRKPGRPRRVPKNTLPVEPVYPSEDFLYYCVNSDFLKYSSRRMSRQCGECEACVRKVDCGSCDFCFDKPKFGGGNRKRQKCRWRQCLRYAMKRLLPVVWTNQQWVDTGVLVTRKYKKNTFARRKVAKVKQAARMARQSGTQPVRMRSRAVPQKTAELEIQEHLPNLLFKEGHLESVPDALVFPMMHHVIEQDVVEVTIGDIHMPAEEMSPNVADSIGQPQAVNGLCVKDERDPNQSLSTEESGVEDVSAPSMPELIKQVAEEEHSELHTQAWVEGSELPLLHMPCLIKEETCAEDVSEQIIPVASVLPSRALCLSLKVTDCLIRNEEEAVDEGTPVITEIFSLGSYQAISKLDRVLQEFLLELNEIPLPALWEVLPPDGPDLKLVQRSSLSSMASTVVHIQPGLFFQVIVQDRLVPPGHELFANHPSHLTTVDDVVELICDLEAYQPCAGYAFASSSPPQQNVHSPACRVLVYKERCENCSAAANETLGRLTF